MKLHRLTNFCLLSLCLLIALLYNQPPVSAQYSPAQIDSFQHEIESQHDTVLFDTYYSLAKTYAPTNTDSAVMYAQELINVCSRIEGTEYIARGWRVLGEVYDSGELLDSAVNAALIAIQQVDLCSTFDCGIERYYATYHAVDIRRRQNRRLEALTISNKTLNHPFTHRNIRVPLLTDQGSILNQLGDYDNAIIVLREALTISREGEDPYMEGYIISQLIDTYRFTNSDADLMTLSRQMLHLGRTADVPALIPAGLGNIGTAHEENGQIDSAIYYYKLAINESDENSISQYGNAVAGLIRIYNTHSDTRAAAYIQKGEVFLKEKDLLLPSYPRSNLYEALFNYHYNSGNFRNAEQYSRTYLNPLRDPISDTTKNLVKGMRNLSKALAAQNKHEEAWELTQQTYDLQMAIVNRNQAYALAKTAVDMDLTENKLARQKAEQATLIEKQASSARSRLFMLLLVIVGLILAGVVWAYRRTQNDKRLISEKSQLVEQSLAEKEVLLREIHHRVKNNLQIISSLLDKQARKSSDTAVRKLVKEGQERIQSMALIHQNLYESEQLSGIDIKSYLQELSNNIQKSQAVSPDQVQLELHVEDEKLDIDTAIPVGLILNELLTNSYKYAFAEKEKGKITVDFKKEGDKYRLQVSDNGIGFSSAEAAYQSKSLGLNLVNGLVRQLDGTIEWLEVNKGVAVAIQF